MTGRGLPVITDRLDRGRGCTFVKPSAVKAEPQKTRALRGCPTATRRRTLQLPYGIVGAVGLGSRGEHFEEATPSRLGSILG